MASLMLHCGAQPTDMQQLSQLPAPTPLGPKHNPYPFADFVSTTLDTIKSFGLNPTQTHLGLSANQKRLFGIIETESQHTDFAPLISLRGSYDQSLALAVGAGTRTFVCDNTSFHSDHVLRALNTTNVKSRADQKLNAVIARFLEEWTQVEQQFDLWKETAAEKAIVDAAITQMMREQIIPATVAPKVIKLVDTPSHQEYIPGSVYHLFQATTEALKPDKPLSDPTRHQVRTQRLHAFCNALAGVQEKPFTDLSAMNETTLDVLEAA